MTDGTHDDSTRSDSTRRDSTRRDSTRRDSTRSDRPESGGGAHPPAPRGRSAGARSRLLLGAAALAVVVGGIAAGAALAAGNGRPRAASGSSTSVAPVTCRAGTPEVTVTGTGTVSVTPDLLVLRLTVHTTGQQATTALGSNDTTTAAVLHVLRAGGIAAKDLQTTDFSISPDYANTGSTLTGYSVDNTIVARVHAIGSAGTLIDAAVAAGRNAVRINSVSFSVTHPLHAQGLARTMAVHQAIAHAKAIAAASGRRLGGICSLRDNTTSTTTPGILSAYGAASAMLAPRAPAVLESGSQTVSGDVTIVLALS